ncbi:MAG: hypothetical protein ACTHW1_01385 [Ancrocorticia sp.]|uniref:hypothetical protein n=1 Tax=Ancrocorticia sp. TaxID=2593684 RepID=UPI003F933B19
MSSRVLVDADVLFSRTIRDWLFLSRCNGAFYTVHATRDILAETVARIRDNNPLLTGNQIENLHQHLMRSIDSLETDYTPEESSIPDQGDWHVHAAANQCGMDYLVTNDQGFLTLPETVTDGFHYETFSPDDFLCLLDDSNSRSIAKVTQEQNRYWQERSSSRPLDEALERAGCPMFAQRVRTHIEAIARTPVTTNGNLRIMTSTLGL